MTTPVTRETPPTPEPPRRRRAAVAVSIFTIVVGACVALGTLAGTGASAVSVLRDLDRGSSTYDSAVGGLDDLDIEIAGGTLRVIYGDVQTAQLDAERGRNGWTFERRGDSLRVESPTASFLDGGTGSSATLTLPRDLEGTGIVADIQVSGGTLDLAGDFGAVTARVAAGLVTVDGAVGEVDLSVSGGSASARLSDVTTARFELAGGELTARVSGDAPARTDVEVTAGSADITLPDDEYRVSVDDGLGSVDNGLRTSATAAAEVDVEATMGSVRLRS